MPIPGYGRHRRQDRLAVATDGLPYLRLPLGHASPYQCLRRPLCLWSRPAWSSASGRLRRTWRLLLLSRNSCPRSSGSKSGLSYRRPTSAVDLRVRPPSIGNAEGLGVRAGQFEGPQYRHGSPSSSAADVGTRHPGYRCQCLSGPDDVSSGSLQPSEV